MTGALQFESLRRSCSSHDVALQVNVYYCTVAARRYAYCPGDSNPDQKDKCALRWSVLTRAPIRGPALVCPNPSPNQRTCTLAQVPIHVVHD